MGVCKLLKPPEHVRKRQCWPALQLMLETLFFRSREQGAAVLGAQEQVCTPKHEQYFRGGSTRFVPLCS